MVAVYKGIYSADPSKLILSSDYSEFLSLFSASIDSTTTLLDSSCWAVSIDSPTISPACIYLID